ncbi:MAG TPA: DUF58 domain-containing protein [Burkholderiales bacterium]|nr:DUF58 domain-containing protein [Burkholderiales bacterium]
MPADATLKQTQPRLGRHNAPAGTLRDRIGDWIFRPRGVESAPVTLSQRRVYILPTKAGLLFAMTLALMLIGSINYNLSLGYGLTFLLTGTGIVSMLHTWRNLAKLQLRPGKTDSVFAGDWAHFAIIAENRGSTHRHSVGISIATHEPTYFDVEAASESNVKVAVPARRRGMFRPGRFRIFTTYPLGLFYAWANVELDLGCLVYPVPEAGEVPLPEARATAGPGNAAGAGEEDFAGLRNYQPGDSPRRIAWKALARNDVFATKLFSGASGTQLWLDYGALPDSLGIERRLSRMTRWVLDATETGLRYGLRLPGREIKFGAGEAQQAKCLEALATFQVKDSR